MPKFTPPRMHVVRKEDKEGRLKAFVGEHLAVIAAGASKGEDLTIIARSFESPVVRALAAYRNEIKAAGLNIRAIVVLSEGANEQVTELLGSSPTRQGCDPRLLDAHEQLAFGDRVAWIGDCMRREPAKRDAYEIYSPECAETAALARRSFERVWTFAGAGKTMSGPAVLAASPAAEPVEVALAALSEGEPSPTVSSRH
ncbi:MAG: hypothetical protein MUC37_02495 [Hyphomicrobium sp.]|jgi:hypothetical protein|nr:hypothetical protein [Hyphomicrobium sp.]